MLYGTTALLALALALPGAEAQLNKLAKAAGKLYFGSATDNGELSDTAYVNILKNTDEFGQIVSFFLALSPSLLKLFSLFAFLFFGSLPLFINCSVSIYSTIRFSQ